MHTRLGSIIKWASIVVLSLIILLLTVYLIGFQSVEIIGERIECSTNVPFGFEYVCDLKRYDNDTQSWTFDWSIPDGIAIENLMARLTTFRQEKDGAYEIAYFGNTTFDVCEAIESHMSRIFVALYLPDLWNMGNVMESCPRTGQIYLHNFRFKRNLTLPRFLTGKWLLDVNFYFIEFEAITAAVRVFLEIRPIPWTYL